VIGSRVQQLSRPADQSAHPFIQATLPRQFVGGILVDQPAADILRADRQEPARVGRDVGPIGLKMLDDEVHAIEPPDLDYAEHRLDRGSVDLGAGHVDFDRQVGVGIIGRFL
jgi:hypothetical protein